MPTLDLCQDRLRLGSPDERLGRLTLVGKVAVDRGLEVDEGMQDATLQTAFGELAKKPSTALSQMRLPAPNTQLGLAGATHDLDRAQLIGRQKHDPRPPDVLLSAVSIGHQRRQPRTIGSREPKAAGFSHSRYLPRPNHKSNSYVRDYPLDVNPSRAFVALSLSTEAIKPRRDVNRWSRPSTWWKMAGVTPLDGHCSGRSGWKLEGLGVFRRGELGHGLELYVAVLELPLIVLLHKEDTDEANDGRLVRDDPDQGYAQVWCTGSGGGLLLGSLHGLAVTEVDASDELTEAFRAVETAPVPLGRLGELEHHGERGLARQAALGLGGP